MTFQISKYDAKNTLNKANKIFLDISIPFSKKKKKKNNKRKKNNLYFLLFQNFDCFIQHIFDLSTPPLNVQYINLPKDTFELQLT